MKLNENAVFAIGLEDALVGYAQRCGQPTVAVYDSDKVIEIFVKDGMEQDEAMEYFEFNVLGSWVGKNTPCWLTKIDVGDIDMEIFDA